MRKLTVIAVLVSLLVSAFIFPAHAQQAQQPEPPAVIQPDLFTRASDALDNQQYDKAVLDMSLFILLNPTFSPAYYARAQGHLGLNDLESALSDVDRAIDIAVTTETPSFNATLYSLRAEIDRQRQNLDEALEDYSMSIALEPTVEALANRGLLYFSQSDFPHALTDFSDAVDMDASNPVLYLYRGLVNSGLADVQAAGSDYLSFLGLVQTNSIDRDAIETGQQVSLQVDRGTVYHIPFTAKAGQYASALAVASAGSVDPLMVLLDPDGGALAGDDDGGGNTAALILNYEIPEDGEYSLVIGHSLGGFSGTIALQIQVSDEPAQ
jgi:tetratricopeptide (TPR) repeat protein